jgi:hypothetical protein
LYFPSIIFGDPSIDLVKLSDNTNFPQFFI